MSQPVFMSNENHWNNRLSTDDRLLLAALSGFPTARPFAELLYDLVVMGDYEKAKSLLDLATTKRSFPKEELQLRFNEVMTFCRENNHPVDEFDLLIKNNFKEE